MQWLGPYEGLGEAVWQLTADETHYTDGISLLRRASSVIGKPLPRLPHIMRAADIGTEAHRVIQYVQCGCPTPVEGPDEAFREAVTYALASWTKWLSSAVWIPWVLEWTVGDADLRAAGTVDALGILQLPGWTRPLRAGIDWKTGQKRAADHQKNALYDILLKREHGMEVDVWVNVYLDKKQGKPGKADPIFAHQLDHLRRDALDKCQENI